MAPHNFHAANWQKNNHCCQSWLVSSHGKYFFFNLKALGNALKL